MALLKKWTEQDGCFGIWRVTESVETLMTMLDDTDRYARELHDMKSEARRLEYVAVRVLLKELLNKEVHIDHLPSGKPFLIDYDCNISISHTRGYVAVALHRVMEPGIDIEYYSERVKKVASRFMGVTEMKNVEGYTGVEYIHMLMLHWSAKETIYKVMDAEQVDFAQHIILSPFAYSASGRFHVQENKTPNSAKINVSYIANESFVCTWCLK